MYSSYITVIILFMVNLLNYMDRFTIAGVLPDIVKDYGLQDKSAGFLQTVFIISYMVMAPLFGYLGDRYARKTILLCGILFWSTTTFLGSIVPNNAWYIFFVMRALVGTGEASYSTIAPTLIADLFPRDMRTRMLAIFYFAIPIGSGLGYIIGSSVAQQMGGWRWALRVTPPFGLLSVLFMLIFLKEPERGHSDGAIVQQQKNSITDDLKYLLTVKTYLWSTAGFTCVCFAIGSLSWWAPTFMDLALKVEANDTSDFTENELQRVSLIFGIITCIGGVFGVVLGSVGAQIYRNYNASADPLVCALGVLCGVPFAFFGIAFAHLSSNTSWVLIFIGITLLCTNWALVADILLYVIEPNRRSFAQAIQILISHLFGDACSPFLIGALMDSLSHGNATNVVKYTSLQHSLYIMPFILVVGGLAFLYTSLFVIVDQESCRLKSHGQRERNSSETSIHTLPPRMDANSVNSLSFEAANTDIENLISS